MPETWVVILGTVIVSVIMFTIAYNLVSASIIQIQRQQFVKDFTELSIQTEVLCDQITNESFTTKLRMPNSLRVIFATDDRSFLLDQKEARGLIKSREISSGNYLCYQFSTDEESRCYPDLPDKLKCSVNIPYIGVLADYEDIFQNVRRILGMPKVKEDILTIRKVSDTVINVTYEEPEITETTTTTSTTTSPTKKGGVVFVYSDEKDREFDNLEITLHQRVKDFGFGYVDKISVNDLSSLDLSSTDIVILAHPAERKISSSLDKLEDWVRNGGTLIGVGLKTDEQKLKGIFGVDGNVEESIFDPVKSERAILSIKPSSDIFDGIDVNEIPVYGFVLKYQTVKGTQLAEVKDKNGDVVGTGIVENSYGNGKAYYFGYAIGYSSLRIMQGKGLDASPSEYMADDQVLTTSEEWRYPTADFQIYPILNIIKDKYGFFIYWIPEGKKFSFIPTGDTEAISDQNSQVWINEVQTRNLKGTLFLLNDIKRSASNYPNKNGIEFGPHRAFGEPYTDAVKRMKDWGFGEQISTRNHYLKWNGFEKYPKEMKQAGLIFSSNLQAQKPKDMYSFGTSLPHYFFDLDGNNVEVLEFPIFLQDLSFARTNIVSYVDDVYSTVTKYNSFGTFLFHPIHVYNDPKGFQHFLDKIKADDVHVDTLKGVGTWWNERDKIQFTSFSSNAFEFTSPQISGITFASSSDKIKIDGTEYSCENEVQIFADSYCLYGTDLSQGKHKIEISNQGSNQLKRPDVTNADEPLETPTYDGSGQAVHPDIVFVKEGWNGYKYWLALTPYPRGTESLENPSILASNDGTSWNVPSGLTNPLHKPSSGHDADPDIILVNNKAMLYFLEVPTVSSTRLLLTTSENGVDWSNPDDMMSINGVSPSVIFENGQYFLFYVNVDSCSSSSSSIRMLTSSDGVQFSDEKVLSIELKDYVLWHIDVEKYLDKYIMLIAAYKKGSACGSTELFFATSEDKVNWNVDPNPIIRPASGNWDSQEIYRSTFIIDNNKMRIWYSARDGMSNWYIGYTEDSEWP